jgi:hypothetical protein
MAYMGDLEGAHRYVDEYQREIGETSSIQDRAYVMAARCVISFVEGDFAAVLDMGLHNAEPQTFEYMSPHAVVGRAALWNGDAHSAQLDLERRERSTVRTAWQRCIRLTLEAGLAVLRGEGDIEMYDPILAEWDRLVIPLGKAFCQADMAILIGGSETRRASTEAEEFFAQAGNGYLTRRLVEARAAAP